MNVTRFVVLALLLSLSSTAWGQVWFEVGDAPEGVPDRQDTEGSGPLTQIMGHLSPSSGDFVDTYSITITDPLLFFASTSQHLGGFVRSGPERLLNSRLWMWTEDTLSDGLTRVLLANDDDPNFGSSDFGATIAHPDQYSMLTGGMVDPSAANANIVAGQKYLISISVTPNDPQDLMGNDLAELGPSPSFRLVGPNLSAGPFDRWENPPNNESDTYTIALQGATFCLVVPEPTIGGVFLLGGALFVRRRIARSAS